jgi:hypothetical protein
MKMKWFHKLLHPHCADCAKQEEAKLERERESRVCNTCEVLRLQNAQLIEERDRLLDRLLNPSVPTEEKADTKEINPILPKRFIPFSVRRQILEAEDRHKAELLRKNAHNPTITKLEKELGIEDAVSTSDAQVQTR